MDLLNHFSNRFNESLLREPFRSMRGAGQTYRGDVPRPTTGCSLAHITPAPEQSIGPTDNAYRDQNMVYADFIIQSLSKACCILSGFPPGFPPGVPPGLLGGEAPRNLTEATQQMPTTHQDHEFSHAQSISRRRRLRSRYLDEGLDGCSL